MFRQSFEAFQQLQGACDDGGSTTVGVLRPHGHGGKKNFGEENVGFIWICMDCTYGVEFIPHNVMYDDRVAEGPKKIS